MTTPDDAEPAPDDQPVLIASDGTAVPRWVVKAIALFWVGWAVTYLLSLIHI